jgi:hypothetical protein
MMLDRLNARKITPSARPQWLAFAAPALLILPLFGLWMISTPPDAKARLAELEAKAERIQKTTRGAGDLKAFPAGSVCSGEAPDAVESRMSLALANAGLQVGAFHLVDTNTTSAGLQTWRLSLKGMGSYESAVAALDVLNRSRPRLFVDTVALRNKVSDVELEVEGRVFCR